MIATLAALSLSLLPPGPQLGEDSLVQALGTTLTLPAEVEWIGQPAAGDGETTFVAFLWGGAWCGPCVRMIGQVGPLVEEFAGRAVFYGVCTDTAENVRKILDRHPELALPSAVLELDEHGALVRKLGLHGTPSFVVHDAAGRIFAIGHPHSAATFAPRLELPAGSGAELERLRIVLEQGPPARLDPEVAERAAALRGDLAIAREAGDAAIELEILDELAQLGEAFGRYGVLHLEKLLANPELAPGAWDYGVGLLARLGHLPDAVRLLEERCIKPLMSKDREVALQRYETLAQMGPSYQYLLLNAYGELARRGPSAHDYGVGLVERLGGDATQLLQLARMASEGRAGADDSELAVLAAEAACQASQMQDGDALVLAAELAFGAGELDRAIQRMEAAARVVQEGPDKQEAEKRLAYFRLKKRRAGN